MMAHIHALRMKEEKWTERLTASEQGGARHLLTTLRVIVLDRVKASCSWMMLKHCIPSNAVLSQF